MNSWQAFGVDFSGARRHQKKIWVANLDGSRPATTRRGWSHADLLREIISSAPNVDSKRSLWLIDAPIGIPRKQLEMHSVAPDWQAAANWLTSFEDAREWRRACRAISRKEPRRICDARFQTPLAPMNIRLFKQTWHAITSVFLPLASVEHVALLPLALSGVTGEAEKSSILERPVQVVESCPASILRRRSWPHRGYKGRGEQCRATRSTILEKLTSEAALEIEPESRARALSDSEGDALDSLILLTAALGLAEADHSGILNAEPDASFEGWVYI